MRTSRFWGGHRGAREERARTAVVVFDDDRPRGAQIEQTDLTRVVPGGQQHARLVLEAQRRHAVFAASRRLHAPCRRAVTHRRISHLGCTRDRLVRSV